MNRDVTAGGVWIKELQPDTILVAVVVERKTKTSGDCLILGWYSNPEVEELQLAHDFGWLKLA